MSDEMNPYTGKPRIWPDALNMRNLERALATHNHSTITQEMIIDALDRIETTPSGEKNLQHWKAIAAEQGPDAMLKLRIHNHTFYNRSSNVIFIDGSYTSTPVVTESGAIAHLDLAAAINHELAHSAAPPVEGKIETSFLQKAKERYVEALAMAEQGSEKLQTLTHGTEEYQNTKNFTERYAKRAERFGPLVREQVILNDQYITEEEKPSMAAEAEIMLGNKTRPVYGAHWEGPNPPAHLKDATIAQMSAQYAFSKPPPKEMLNELLSNRDVPLFDEEIPSNLQRRELYEGIMQKHGIDLKAIPWMQLSIQQFDAASTPLSPTNSADIDGQAKANALLSSIRIESPNRIDAPPSTQTDQLPKSPTHKR